ncbi:MAG TPA: efflux RND transporter periplasmic adaptor subunit [Vicinamibacterales bacterium]|nr:efflux RND transporter periplasmic adaptor subunit [Vicinamibacterales bacterium]
MIRPALVGAALFLVVSSACARGEAHSQPRALPRPPIDETGDGSLVRVAYAERFALAAAAERRTAPELSVTGVVSPDVSRAVPVVSLASGRVVDVRVRLGDEVRQGQLLLRIQSADVAAAFADYRKAVANETLARTQLERARTLFAEEAVAKKDLEAAQDTEDKAVVDAQTTAERLRVLGASTDRPPTGVIEITAPTSGIITEQNVATAAGVKSLDNSPSLFTISDLSRVWVLCDVHERDLASVRVGDSADIRLSAYPDRVLTGRITNIGAVLDPNLRTAKVRIEMANSGVISVGMFVSATFHGQTMTLHAVVPAAAVLRLHDRDWVYVPAGHGEFVRREVVCGETLPGQQQELLSGLRPGERVVASALAFQTAVEQ